MTDRYARIIIIGGGAIGCSLAYHLACAGECDVLLLEKAQLTHGCTWHAAGLVGQLRGKRNLTRLMQDSVAVFDRLEEETGQAIDWKKVGSLRLASSNERWSEIKRSMTQAKSFGFEVHSLDAHGARDLFPFIETEGIVGAAFIPSDGYVDPHSLTQAYARGARAGGVTIREGVLVEDIVVSNGRVTEIVTDNGNFGCEIAVNCAGLWARPVGRLAGVPLAAGVVEHQYMVTEKTLEFDSDLPTLRDPDKNFYLKPDVGSFAIGGWEEGTRGCWQGSPPNAFGRELFAESYDRFEKISTPATERLPVLREIGVQTLVNGPIPVSADGEPIMGLAPGLDNFYLACGFTAGIAASGGAGHAMANWILEGDPGMDLWPFDARRFGAHHANARFLEERAIESYARYYQIHWLGEEAVAGRGLRRSPLHDRLLSAGAVYGSKFGWERPNWFAIGKDTERGEPTFEGKPVWFEAVGAEHKAVRERVALFDQSSFAKFDVKGPGSLGFLQRLVANNLSEGLGRCTYTQMCNEHGGIEADLTIMQIGADFFHVVTGSGFGVRDRNWMQSHLPNDGSVDLTDVTSSYAVINLCGPLAREVLQAVTDDDVSNDAFPYLAVRDIEVGLATVRAARIGYVGELGWELYIPVEMAAHVHETLWRAGQVAGIVNAGYKAIESLRLEKGYVYWSAEVGPDYSPYEAGLGYCVALDKGDFIGRKALRRIREEGPYCTLCTFTVEGHAPLYGGEAIVLDGEVVGVTTSGGYGYTVGKTIALGYLPCELADATAFEIEAFGKAYAARKGARTLYDPKMRNLRS